MTENSAMSVRVDRYVRGKLDDGETRAFETELLESPELQDALEVALGLQSAVARERRQGSAQIIHLQAAGRTVGTPPRRQPQWALAASIVIAAGAAGLLWRSGVENAQLNSRILELTRPVETVLTVPLDVMRSAGAHAADVRIRKPAGAAVLILDVEVPAQMADASPLNVELRKDQGAELLRWSARPNASGRIQFALRTDQLPDGRLVLHMSNPVSGDADSRSIELLPSP
jgi:hypothetical protein